MLLLFCRIKMFLYFIVCVKTLQFKILLICLLITLQMIVFLMSVYYYRLRIFNYFAIASTWFHITKQDVSIYLKPVRIIRKRILLILQIMFKNKLKNKDDIFKITKKEMIICNKISSYNNSKLQRWRKYI